MRKILKPRALLAIFVLTVLFYPVLYALFHGFTTFESSDTNWWDNEVVVKGRGLEDIVFQYELYKLRCNAPTAMLVRTTPKNSFNIFAWPGYLYDEKWKVPYGAPSNKSRESFVGSIIGKEHCYTTPKTDRDSDLEMVHQATQRFIANLSSVKQPPLFEK